MTETRLDSLLRAGRATPRFLQGVYPFVGHGLFEVAPLDPQALSYVVPAGATAEVHYFRAGNHSDDLIYLSLLKDGAAVRYFPVGPKADLHVALAIVEPHGPGSRLEVALAAPRGVSGTVVVDIGIVEVRAAGGGAPE